jgi:hypothetical protein
MRHISFIVFGIALLLLFACRETTFEGLAPRTWIDAPLDGSAHPLETLIVQSHASDQNGVAQVELYVNDALVRADAPSDMTQKLVSLQQPWQPPGSGEFKLQIVAKNAAGTIGHSLPVRVRVGASIAQGKTPSLPPARYDTVTPTPTTTSPPKPPISPIPQPPVIPTLNQPPDVVSPIPPRVISVTPQPPRPISVTPRSITPTPRIISPTPIPPSPTNTNTPLPPPPQVQFSADATSLTLGQCTVLHWRTEFVQAVFLNGQGVVGDGDQQVCPKKTTTYTLQVQHTGGTITRQVAIQVSAPPKPTNTHTPTPPPPPSDTQPPGIKNIDESSDPIWYGTSGCAGDYFVEIEADVADASGIGSVALFYKRQGTQQFQMMGMKSIGGNRYRSGRIQSKQVAGGGSQDQFIEYYLRAADSKGNESNSPTNTVRMRYCLI